MSKFRLLRRLKKYIVLLCIALFFFALFFSISYIFTVRHVEVIGVNSLNGTVLAKNKLIFLLSSDDLSKRLLTLNPNVESVEVTTRLPGTIILSVKKDQPIGLLEIANGYLYVSKRAKVLSKVREIENQPHYPMMSYYQKYDYNEYSPGEIIKENDIQYGLYFLNELQDLGVTVTKLAITNADMLLLKTDDEKTYIFTTKREKSEQLQEFKSIYRKFKIEKTDFKIADFRFDKPVVTF